ncbi:ABC transporter ATP-binding protein [Paraburkholderia dipogonis]|uniref:ABC transporter ATP-binding protein n=2 Tax=Paraburkholderia dipogonis TaxID=1211383 RepID=A0A4Y8MI12_9BURK|nr:ABC transporter ATP-binding protein [Paraburkholderia dipogonis]
MQSSVLRLADVHVHYGKFHAVHGVTIQARSGEITSIIGANGAGKSSTLKAIIGQAGTVSGSIRLGSEELAGRTTREVIRKGIALVPEGRWLFPTLSVEENLSIGTQVGRPGGPTMSEIFDWFPVLGERRSQAARELSGGQQQMVAIGRALLTNPKFLLCDEISLGLAPIVVNQLYELFPRICERGIGVVVVEQDIARSLAVASRFYCFLEGRVTLTGDPNSVSRESVVKHYFGSRA